MNRVWKKRLLRVIGIILVLVILVILINPLPKFIRYQINKSVSDLEIEGVFIKNVVDFEVDGIPVRVYNSDMNLKPGIFHIPGGAFIAGNLETHDNISRYLASELNSVVISLDYSKAPENKYPKGLKDSEMILNWILENHKDLNINSSQLILVGDSGGANFCAVLAQKYKDLITGQVLINPALDLTNKGPAYKNWGMFVEWYLKNLSESTDENISPLLAKSFLGLPNTVIVTCENDPLKTDGERYKKELEKANVPVVLKEFLGLGHLANLWAGTAPETEVVRKFVVDETKNMFN